MKILQISVRADIGGGPEHMYKLSAHLPSEMECYYAIPNDYPYYEKFQQLGGAGHSIVIPHRKFTIETLVRLYRFVTKNRIDLIHAHGKGASMYARPLSILSGLPCVYTFHGIHTGKYGTLKKAGYLWIERILGWFTDAFISVSPSEYAVVKSLHFCSMKKVHIVPNGVQVPDVISGRDDSAEFTVVHVTRYDYQKNTFAVLEIAELLKVTSGACKIRIVVVGDGEERAAFERAVAERDLGDIITVAGASTDMPMYYQRAQCILSTSRWEGLPLAIIEGMSYGLIPVLTDVTGNQDVVEPGREGFLFPEHAYDEAAEILRKLSGDVHYANELAKAARVKVTTRFNVLHMAEETATLYTRIQEKINA